MMKLDNIGGENKISNVRDVNTQSTNMFVRENISLGINVWSVNTTYLEFYGFFLSKEMSKSFLPHLCPRKEKKMSICQSVAVCLSRIHVRRKRDSTVKVKGLQLLRTTNYQSFSNYKDCPCSSSVVL